MIKSDFGKQVKNAKGVTVGFVKEDKTIKKRLPSLKTTKVTEETNENGEKEIIIEEKEFNVSIEQKETKVTIKKYTNVLDVVLDIIACVPAVGCVNPAKFVKYVKTGLKYMKKAMDCIPKLIPFVVNAKYELRKMKRFVSKWTGKIVKFAVALFKRAEVFTIVEGKVVEGKEREDKVTVVRIISIYIKRNLKEVNLVAKCFTGDTLVLTKSGLCPIRQVRIGDDIYSRNDVTKETGLKKVEEVFRTEAHTIYHIRMDGKAELKTTAYHPIFVKDKGWVNAINLKENMLVETKDGSAKVTGIEKIRQEEPVEVFNFHVEDWESYFVSEISIYVHNKNGAHVNAHPHGIYKDAPYHPASKKGPKGKHMPKGKGYKSERPKNGQAALDRSVPAKSGTSNKRLAREGDKAVVLHQDSPGEYHGFLRDFKDLPQEDKNVLIQKGIFNRRGK